MGNTQTTNAGGTSNPNAEALGVLGDVLGHIVQSASTPSSTASSDGGVPTGIMSLMEGVTDAMSGFAARGDEGVRQRARDGQLLLSYFRGMLARAATSPDGAQDVQGALECVVNRIRARAPLEDVQEAHDRFMTAFATATWVPEGGSEGAAPDASTPAHEGGATVHDAAAITPHTPATGGASPEAAPPPVVAGTGGAGLTYDTFLEDVGQAMARRVSRERARTCAGKEIPRVYAHEAVSAGDVGTVQWVHSLFPAAFRGSHLLMLQMMSADPDNAEVCEYLRGLRGRVDEGGDDGAANEGVSEEGGVTPSECVVM